MPAAPQPTNGTGSKEQIDQARAQFRETLRKMKTKKTARLDKLRAKLTTIAAEGDAERRRGYLEEADAD